MNENILFDYSLVDKYGLSFFEENYILPKNEEKIFIELYSYTNINKQVLENHFLKPVKVYVIKKDILEFHLKQLQFKMQINTLAYKSLLTYNDKTHDKNNIHKLLHKILEFIINLKSSDLHMEVQMEKTILKARIDGQLQEIFSHDKNLFFMLSAICKLEANLDVAKKKVPQDGRFSLNLQNKKYDFRISIVPTINSNESIVIRVLDNNNNFLDLEKLGLETNQIKIIQKNIQTLKGMILVTGTTGSGKTTTIYSIIKSLDTKSKKIITVEDPVEYDIQGINQINIDEQRGLTFQSILKNILRQDPDVIFIGEIRDSVSLKLAIQAALTGHLVIATLHTNDTIKTIDRLYDLGAEPFLIASVLKLIVSQKLVKILCEHCKELYLDEENILYRSVGCKECNFNGFNKRDLVVEILEINREIETLIHQKKSHKINIKRSEQLSIKLHKKLLDGKISLAEYISHAF
jgi:general secretion pathway protein E